MKAEILCSISVSNVVMPHPSHLIPAEEKVHSRTVHVVQTCCHQKCKRGCRSYEETPVSLEWVRRNNAGIHFMWNFTDFYLSAFKHEINSQLASHTSPSTHLLCISFYLSRPPLRMSSRQSTAHYVTYINKPDYTPYITTEYILQNNKNKSHIFPPLAKEMSSFQI